MKTLNRFLLPVIMILFPIGCFSQALFNEKIILENFQGATCIAAADFDADSDIDFVVTGNDGDHIAWFENDGHQNFTQHMIITGFDGAKGIVAARIDANDSWDVVATAAKDGKFSWFSNDGTGNFTEHIIADSNWASAGFVQAADIDSDNDQDLILIACDSHKIGWAKNDGSGNFSIHILKENWTKVNSATAVDFDNDNDMDIIATAKAGQVIWFVNDGESNFSEQVLISNLPGANSIQVADFDNDGDPDMVATACDNTDKVSWFENTGNYIFQEHLLRDKYNGARACKISDIDQDGDTDVLAIAWTTGVTSFFENNGAGNFTERVFCGSAYDMINLWVVDLDKDNDLDILGACYGDHEIRWWESINTFLIPDFKADSLSGNGSLHVHFTNLSYSRPAIRSWSWDFNSDGIVDSHDQHPSRYFETPGYYSVTLVVTSDSLSDTIVKNDYIRVFDGESSLEFNGSNSRVKCNNDSVVDITGMFTIEAWVKPLGFGETGTAKIFDKMMISVFAYQSGAVTNTDSCYAVLMAHSNGTVSTFSTPSGSVKLNGWQHLAITYNDSTSEAHFYLDGSDQPLNMVIPPEGAISSNTNREITLGNARTGNTAFDGCIDEVRLWNCVRTLDEIEEWMGKNLPEEQQNLSGYWKMNESIGDTASDKSGCNHHGSLNNVQWAQGVHLSSVSIDEKEIAPNPAISAVTIAPNPVKNTASLLFRVIEPGIFSLILYDISGKPIRIHLRDQELPKGNHSVKWDGRNDIGEPLPAGTYFCVLSSANHRKSTPLILIK